MSVENAIFLNRTQIDSPMDDSFWEEIERSRKLTPEQRFKGTLDLIDLVYEINVAGIRDRFPDADDAQIRAILLERRRIVQSLDAVA
jgi:hypothetical protein